MCISQVNNYGDMYLMGEKIRFARATISLEKNIKFKISDIF